MNIREVIYYVYLDALENHPTNQVFTLLVWFLPQCIKKNPRLFLVYLGSRGKKVTEVLKTANLIKDSQNLLSAPFILDVSIIHKKTKQLK